MSTDPQHKKQNKSMFILLSIISILVISTLVVASIYFLKPNIKPTPRKSLTTQIETPRQTIIEQSKLDEPQTKKTEMLAKIEKHNAAGDKNTHINAQADNQSTQETCKIHFSDNQLLVKNTDRK